MSDHVTEILMVVADKQKRVESLEAEIATLRQERDVREAQIVTDTDYLLAKAEAAEAENARLRGAIEAAKALFRRFGHPAAAHELADVLTPPAWKRMKSEQETR